MRHAEPSECVHSRNATCLCALTPNWTTPRFFAEEAGWIAPSFRPASVHTSASDGDLPVIASLHLARFPAENTASRMARPARAVAYIVHLIAVGVPSRCSGYRRGSHAVARPRRIAWLLVRLRAALDDAGAPTRRLVPKRLEWVFICLRVAPDDAEPPTRWPVCRRIAWLFMCHPVAQDDAAAPACLCVERCMAWLIENYPIRCDPDCNRAAARRGGDRHNFS